MDKIPEGLRIRGTDKVAFLKQFDASGIDGMSFSVTPIKYLNHEGHELSAHATGFIYKHDTSYYLVTALHCLSGRNVFTGKNLSPTGFIPNSIRIWPTHRLASGQVTRSMMQLVILDDDGDPKWRIDANQSALSVDIAVLPLQTHGLDLHAINDGEDDELLAVSGADCFVLGYPIPSIEDPFLPIWRKGSFASEPRIPIDGKPVFLVDASTSPGMSGAPIIQRWFGPAPVYRNGDLVIMGSQAVTSKLVGVYGGRAHDYKDIGPIGYGWYANRIDGIIKQEHRDTMFSVGLSSGKWSFR
jgi:hypothetical protein